VIGSLTAFKLLPWKLIGVVVAVAVLIGVVWWQVDAYGDRRFAAGEAKVQSDWNDDKRAWADKLAKKGAEYRATEDQLRADAEAIEAKGKAREARLTADLNLALDQLRRDRNARPGGAGGHPAASAVAADGRPGTCSGGELYADDAAILAVVAAQMERDRGHLRRCVEQYNAARKALMSRGSP